MDGNHVSAKNGKGVAERSVAFDLEVSRCTALGLRALPYTALAPRLIWDTFYTKVPIEHVEKSYIEHLECKTETLSVSNHLR